MRIASQRKKGDADIEAKASHGAVETVRSARARPEVEDCDLQLV